MAEVIKMPKMSDTMEEGVIASWLKKTGDTIKSGDILAEVETDKATMELEAYSDGILLHIGVKEGESVAVDGVIAIMGEKGEDIKDLLTSTESGAESKPKEEVVETDSVEMNENIEELDTSNIKATVVTMPKMSDTMEEGIIAAWLKKEGDKVKSGDILAEVETDKATMELEAYEDGTLLYVGVKEGQSVAVEGVIAIIGEKGADVETLLKAQKQKVVATVASSEEVPTETKALDTPVPSITPDLPIESPTNGRVKASPLAKRLAKDLGYDIGLIKGSGDGGRIIKRDVEDFVLGTAAPAAISDPGSGPKALPQVVGEESYEDMPVSQMRKTIGKRLSESKYTAPHFYLTMEINMDKCIEARASINKAAPVKISYNDIIIKATAAALRQHPNVNVSWLGDSIRINHHIHIGVAVAVDEGLLVPVVRFADNKSLSHISAEVKELGTKAREKKLQPSEWEGNTFTISNLGMFGIEEFTAIINPPEACIMAVGGIKQVAVVKDGVLGPGNVMKVTLSCDHRAVDGAVGSAFLKTFKQLMEDPVRILI